MSPAALKTGAVTAATPGSACSGVVDPLDGDPVGGGRDLDDDLDRAVEAGAEAVGEQVVGLALGRAGGGVAVVGRADPHAEHRQRR